MQCLFEKLSEGGVQGELRIFLNFLSTPLTSTNELWKTFPWGNVIEAWGVTIFTFHLFETVFNWKRKTESKSGGSVCPAGNSSLGTRGLDPKRRRDHPHPPRDRPPPTPRGRNMSFTSDHICSVSRAKSRHVYPGGKTAIFTSSLQASQFKQWLSVGGRPL